jgi:hypothetical protein
MKTFAQCVAMGLLTLAACGGSDKTQDGTTPSAATTAAGSSSPAVSGGSGTSAAQASAGRAGGAPASPSSAATSGKAGAAAQPTPSTGAPAGTGGQPATAGAGGAAAALAATSGTGGASAAAAGSSAGGAPAATGDCDRACLLDVMTNYLNAVVAHDPSKVAISPSVRMTDNGAEAKPGDGLWKTATMLVADARLDYADPVTKNVGTQCVMNEGSSPAMYEVRLKVDGGQITEIETMTVRREGAANGFFDATKLKPEPVFLQMPTKPMTREELTTTMNLYLDYLEGKKTGSELPFDQNCKRYENGVATASGMSAFVSQSFWMFHVTRRILILDEAAGIVWGMFPFEQSDTSLVVGEAFKMLDGKIMMIQAVMANMPAKAWD